MPARPKPETSSPETRMPDRLSPPGRPLNIRTPQARFVPEPFKRRCFTTTPESVKKMPSPSPARIVAGLSLSERTSIGRRGSPPPATFKASVPWYSAPALRSSRSPGWYSRAPASRRSPGGRRYSVEAGNEEHPRIIVSASDRRTISGNGVRCTGSLLSLERLFRVEFGPLLAFLGRRRQGVEDVARVGLEGGAGLGRLDLALMELRDQVDQLFRRSMVDLAHRQLDLPQAPHDLFRLRRHEEPVQVDQRQRRLVRILGLLVEDRHRRPHCRVAQHRV